MFAITHSFRSSLALIAAGLFAAATFGRASDTTIQWFGSVDTNYSNAANYSPGTAPSGTTYVEFVGGFTNQPNLTASASTATVWLNSSSAQNVTFSSTGTQTLTLVSSSSGSLTDGRASADIETDGNTSGTQSTLTFNSSVALVITSATSGIYIDDNTAVTIGGTISNTGTAALTLYSDGTSSAGSLTFNGAIQNTGTGTLNLSIGANDGVTGTILKGSTNVGTVSLNAANTYNGTTTLGPSTTGATSITTVVVGNKGAFGTSAVKFYGAALEGADQGSGAADAAFLTGSNKLTNNFTISNITVAGSTTGFVGNDSIEIGGTVTVGAGQVLNNNIASSYLGTPQSLSIDGTLSTSTTSTFTGSGTTNINGAYSTEIIDNMTGDLNFASSSAPTANTVYAGTGTPTFGGTLLNTAASGTVTLSFNPAATNNTFSLPAIADGTNAKTALGLSTGNTAAGSVTLATGSTFTGGSFIGYAGGNLASGNPYNLVFNLGGTAGSAANTTYITDLSQLGSTTNPGLINLGTVNVSNGGAGTFTLPTGYNINFDNLGAFGGSNNPSTVFTGSGSIVINGNIYTNSGNAGQVMNNISGGSLTVNGITYLGTLSVNSNNQIDGSGLTILNGAVDNSPNIAAGNHGYLHYTGTGTLEMNATAGYNGLTYIGEGTSGGYVITGANNAISTGQALTLSAGTLDINTNSQTIVGLNLGGDGGKTVPLTNTTANVIVNGSGILYSKGNINYQPTNTIGSNLTIGTATISNGGRGGGLVELLAAQTFNVGTPYSGSGELVVSVPIGGAFGVTKIGSGTLVLSSTATNTYTGATTVSNGTLQLDGSTSASSAVSVAGTAGSAAVLSGMGTVGGAVTLGGTGTPGTGILAPTPGTTTFTIDGNLTLNAGSTLSLSLGSNQSGPGLTLDGTLVKGTGSGTYNIALNNDGTVVNGQTYEIAAILGGTTFSPTASDLTVTGDAGTLSFDGSGNLDFTVVPEPSTWALLGLGLACMGGIGWRRRLVRA